MLPHLESNCEDIFVLITGDKDFKSGVSSTSMLYDALHTRVPTLTIASFLYAVQTLKFYNVVEAMHEALHG